MNARKNSRKSKLQLRRKPTGEAHAAKCEYCVIKIRPSTAASVETRSVAAHIMSSPFM